MTYRNVKREHVISALAEIDRDGVPKRRESTKYDLHYNELTYPPKYVLSIATKYATGRELPASQFSGGDETNDFLHSLGFEIRKDGVSIFPSDKKHISDKKKEVDDDINICTAIIQIEGDNWYTTRYSTKVKLLDELLKGMDRKTDVLILPAGFLNNNEKSPRRIYKKVERDFTELIKKHNSGLTICFGVDGKSGLKLSLLKSKWDQMGLAINKDGIIAIGRKFHHKYENINLAENAFNKEDGKERYFDVKGKRGYLAVCYDVFGIAHYELENKINANFVVGLIHEFGKSRLKGNVYFAKNGMAGASKQWGVNVYASAVFIEGKNLVKWPSGVKWRQGDASVRYSNYESLRLECDAEEFDADVAKVYLRYYRE